MDLIRNGRRALAGRGCIFIYSGSARLISFEIRLISKELCWAEPEYINMHPPPPPINALNPCMDLKLKSCYGVTLSSATHDYCNFSEAHIHSQKRASWSKSAVGLLPCSHQDDIRMRSYRLLRLDDNKSAARCQQAWWKLIVKTFHMLDASCVNNMQQVCKYQVATSLIFTGLLQP